MLSRGVQRNSPKPRPFPLEPLAGTVLFVIALGASWNTLSLVGLAVMLVMLLATFVLAWSPWIALAMASCYFVGWSVLQVPWASMTLCGALFVYNWFSQRRWGRWWVACGYPAVVLSSWVLRYGWGDFLSNALSFAGLTVFAVVTGWLSGRRIDSEEKLRVENKKALRSTRLLMASELHDSVAQTQTLLVMNLEELAEDPRLDPELAPQVTETLELSRLAAKELRDAMAALRNVDRDFRLMGRSAGHSLTQQWNQVQETLRDSGFGVQARFEADSLQLSQELEHTLARLLGELVTNLVWHGAPGPCRFEVFEEDGSICIRTVNDIAFNAPTKSGGGGDGLLGIRQRVSMLNGTCSFGASGSTWTSEVRVPIQQGEGGFA